MGRRQLSSRFAAIVQLLLRSYLSVGPSRSVKYARYAKPLALTRMEGYAERFLTVTYGAKFTPEKYEIIYFTRSPKRFNIKATLNINSI